MMKLSFNQQYQVYSHYIGDFSLPCSIRCPFPHQTEHNPSFLLFPTDDGDSILWCKRNELDRSGNVITFVREMEDLTLRLTHHHIQQILKGRIQTEHNLTDLKPIVKKSSPANVITSIDYTNAEINWWMKEAGMTTSDMVINDIKSLESISYSNFEIEWKKDEQPKFVFEYYDDYGSRIGWKMYSPMHKKHERKWRSGGIFELGNYRNLPKSAKYLFINSGKKDMMVFFKHVLKEKYPCVYNPSESSIKQLLLRWDELKSRFPNIIYIGDTDHNEHQTGQRIASKIETRLEIPTINFRFTGDTTKDITEEWKFCDGNMTNIIYQLNSFINQY